MPASPYETPFLLVSPVEDSARDLMSELASFLQSPLPELFFRLGIDPKFFLQSGRFFTEVPSLLNREVPPSMATGAMARL